MTSPLLRELKASELPTRADRERAARRLRDSGLKMREIAEMMGVAISTVDGWLNDPGGARLRARKASYGNVCEVCGALTNGSNGPDKAAKVCADCRVWSREAVIDAMRRWAEEHGGIPPTGSEWRTPPEGYPCSTAVIYREGWNNLLLAAGFSLRVDRRPETQERIEEMLREGTPVAEVASVFGVSPAAIYERMKYRGISVKELRAA